MNAIPPTLNTAECIQFLSFWTETTGIGHVTLVAIVPDGATTARTFSPYDDDIADWIKARQDAGCNVYFQPNETKPDCMRKPGKADMVAALCLFADVDPDDEHFSFADERDRLARLAAWLIAHPEFPPTVVIDSGNGMQPIWAIPRTLLEPGIITRIEAETKAIETILGAGGTHNIDRLLRLPGTINYPNRKKLSRGRGVSRARLIHAAVTGFDGIYGLADKLWFTLVDTDDLVQPKPAKAAGKTAGDDTTAALMEVLRTAGAADISAISDLPTELQTRLQDALKARRRLADRWAGLIDDLTEAGKDDSRSGVDLSLAAMLKAAGFGHLDAGLILCAFKHGKVALGTFASVNDGLRYLARCVLNSYDPRASESEKPASPDGEESATKPVIRIVAGELHTAATAAEAAIIEAGKPIYQRGDALVRPIIRDVAASHGRTTKAAGLGEQSPYAMLDVLCAVAEFERLDGRVKDWVRINPPMSVAHILLSRDGQWRLPAVAGVITCPTLRPDGSILIEAGYDAATKLYHVTDDTLQLHPELRQPSRLRAERAVKFLDGLLIDFPFVILENEAGKKRQVARAVALSAIITAVVRGALSVAPLHAFRATSPGSGKSYLADIVSAISTGRLCPVISAAPDEAETEKRIAGLLLAGYPVISIDNVNGELGGDLLCQAIERPLIRVRRLGGSDITEIENRATMFATGNQMRVRGDMVRRTLISDLDANVERPELRKFNARPVDLILANRGHYVSACLMIVLAYIAEGKPNLLPSIASFGDWSDLVRSALVWLGCDDPADSMEAARADDPELSELRELLAVWAEALGFDGYTVAEVAREAERRLIRVSGEPGDHMHPDLREALIRHFGERGVINTRRLAKWLAAREGRIANEHRFSRLNEKAQGGVARWAVTLTVSK